MPDLKLVVGADITQADQALKKLEKDLLALPPATKKVEDGFKKVSPSANGAGQALTNLGRVAQDLPFGFIGIQNNLNPLLESFQRLKVESGSSRLALKALAGSLIGAGGVGLALSLVSSAIVVFQNGIAGFNKKTKEAADTSKDFANSLEDVKAKGIAAGVQLQNFVNIAKDNTQSLATRNEALLQANKLMGDHGEKLTLVNIATAAVTEQINKYTEATIQQGLASKFVDRATDLIIKQREASTAYGEALTKLNQIAAKPGPLSTTSATGEDRITAKGAAIAKQTVAVQDLAAAYRSITRELGGVEISLSDAQIQAAKLFGELGHHKKGEEAKKNIETISDVLAKLARQISVLNEEELLFKTDESKAKISAIEAAIKKLVADFKVSPKDTIIQKLFGDIAALQPLMDKVFGKTLKIKTSAEILFDLEATEKSLNDQLGKVKMTPIKLNLDEGDVIRKAREIAKTVEEINLRMTESIRGTMNEAFASIGESIADSVSSGTDLFQSIFGGLFKVIGAGIKQLGEAMIALGTAKVALEKFKFAPGIGTIIAGIAAVAIGALLQKAIPQFADGVTNFGGGLALVGERGPELVRLPKGSDVIPNHQLGGIGGNTNVFIPDVRIRGNDLVLVFNRASATIGRNG
jgi:hypothetical protein